MSSLIRSFWVTAPGLGEILSPACPPARLPASPPALQPSSYEDEAVVQTLYSAVSRGTESLVFQGRVPANQYTAMRAPFQEGDFPGPVKYGYLNVGRVEAGPPELVGRTVFSLYPHQTRFRVPAAAVTPVPDGVPPERAVLAGTVETALNALWDAPPRIGDRIAVVGAGAVGCSVAALLARYPGIRVQLVDIDPARAAVASALGVEFALPVQAVDDCDLVFHASATQSGLRRSLELLAPEGCVVDLSWYGDEPVTLPLGEFFHSRRLTLRSSQVGVVPPARRGRYTTGDRLALALDLLRDPVFDALVTGESDFDDLPRVMAEITAGRLPGLCHRIRYSSHRPGTAVPSADETPLESSCSPSPSGITS
ncbi:zinc-binding alcohol dehydrogenase [Streptomyces sp. CS014]|uniref:zinc-dependent alcohol dehydrogenase n=1 Tax=Streptomyces sp. CS014 TaxID=2162707 RepID=UPI000D514063|nr:zinc-binding alcohol dehydrogenase [Streptomyces sp. CS014]PVD00261.1 dehydrogenase [Streptomyces sp. CS014]